MIPVFPVHPAPSISGVQICPEGSERCVVFGGSQIHPVPEQVKIYCKTFPMQGVLVSVRYTFISESITESTLVTIVIDECP